MPDPKYEIFDDDGEHYGWVEVPLQINGFPPHYIYVDGIRCLRIKTDSGHKYVWFPNLKEEQSDATPR